MGGVSGLEGVSTDSLPVWLVSGVMSVLFLSWAFPNALGPLSRGISDWADKRREAARAKDDADILERDRVISYQQGVIDMFRRERVADDAAAVEHRRWDVAVMNRHPDMGAAPPLRATPVTGVMPVVPPPEGGE